MRTKQSKERLISIHFTDRLSPKGRNIAGFGEWMLGWRQRQLAALAHQQWCQSPEAVFRPLFDPKEIWRLGLDSPPRSLDHNALRNALAVFGITPIEYGLIAGDDCSHACLKAIEVGKTV